ncbi:hypothetical protein C4K23_4137 [Pseudomonas chlororaphis]|nr:hypothetical protein C4K23_4137 [Pseudomonas chlororaphis]
MLRLTPRMGRFGACCAVDRSLAELGSGLYLDYRTYRRDSSRLIIEEEE